MSLSDDVADYPFTWEVNQNAKGYFQLRVKLKSEELESENFIADKIEEYLLALKKGVERAGFKVQPTPEDIAEVRPTPEDKS
jgi:hypothetical protein